MSDETPIGWEVNERAQRALERLRQGPATTLDLMFEASLLHPARQIWELRHWYGRQVDTRRNEEGIALYTLTGHCR